MSEKRTPQDLKAEKLADALGKLARKEKRERVKKAKKEREDYIMKERMVRAQFHGILRRAKEFTERVIKPKAADSAELERMFALLDPRTSAPAAPRSKKEIDELEVAELWKIFTGGKTRQEYEREQAEKYWKGWAEYRRKLRESKSKEYTLVVGMRPLP